MNITFDHYFGEDNLLEIEAEVSPIIPAISNPGGGGGEPAAGGEVEILTCYLVEFNNYKARVKFNPEGIFIRPWKQIEMRSLVDDIKLAASEKELF
jgi:hypothetical protein